MPAMLLVGYSQSMSMPSRPYLVTALRQFLQKFFRCVSSAAISLKFPASHPPTDRSTFREGFVFLSATILDSRLGDLMSRVSKSPLIWANA